MGTKRPIFDLESLSTAERIQLAEDLWDSVSPESPEIELTAAQAAELDRRLEEMRRYADLAESWEVVRSRLYASLRRDG